MNKPEVWYLQFCCAGKKTQQGHEKQKKRNIKRGFLFFFWGSFFGILIGVIGLFFHFISNYNNHNNNNNDNNHNNNNSYNKNKTINNNENKNITKLPVVIILSAALLFRPLSGSFDGQSSHVKPGMTPPLKVETPVQPCSRPRWRALLAQWLSAPA